MNRTDATNASGASGARDAEFPLAVMSRGCAICTWVLIGLGVIAAGVGAWGLGTHRFALAVLPLIVWAVFGLVWVAFRPRAFAIVPETLWIHWPVRSKQFTTRLITNVRPLKREELGRVLRLCGAGGLWGLFGLCWSKRLGTFDAYLSRSDGMVMIEFSHRRPLVISPERPEKFMAALKNAMPAR